jgi:hypothetical protein
MFSTGCINYQVTMLPKCAFNKKSSTSLLEIYLRGTISTANKNFHVMFILQRNLICQCKDDWVSHVEVTTYSILGFKLAFHEASGNISEA